MTVSGGLASRISVASTFTVHRPSATDTQARSLRTALGNSATATTSVRQTTLAALADFVSPETLKKANEKLSLADSLFTRSQEQTKKSQKEDAQQKLAQDQQRLRALRLEVQRALASGDSRAAAALAQEAAAIAKDLASVAKEYAAAGGSAAAASDGISDAGTALIQGGQGQGGQGTAATAATAPQPTAQAGADTPASISSVAGAVAPGGAGDFLGTVRSTLYQLRGMFDQLRAAARKRAGHDDEGGQEGVLDKASHDFDSAEGQVADLSNAVGAIPTALTAPAISVGAIGAQSINITA